MRAVVTLVVAGSVLVLGGDAARAATEDGEHGASLVWHLVNLVLLLGVLAYFGRAPIRTFFAERRQKIEEGIENAQRELADAEQRLAECQGRVAHLDEELAEIRRVVREQAESERQRLLAEARATSERILRDAVAAADQEVRHARASLQAETAELAVRVAGEILRAQVNDADRARLVDDFVQRVEQTPASGGAGQTPIARD